MDLFLYLDRRTWAHRLDPRAKLFLIAGVSLAALLFSNPRYLVPPIVGTLFIISISHAWSNVRRLWLLVALPFVYCLLLWPLFVTGHTPWFFIGSHQVTEEAVEFGLGMGLRVILMVLAGILLLSTTTIEEFILALQRLGLPVTMGFALSLAFRWVPSLIGSAGTIAQAQRSRGLDVTAGTIVDRFRRYPPLLVPLIGHSLRQTRLLAMALESKGFGPGVRRYPMHRFRMRTIDYMVSIAMAVWAAGCIALRIAGYGQLDVRF